MTDRRKELEKELDDIQKEIEESLHDISKDIHRWTDYRYWVHRYPLQMAGASLALGFILAQAIGRKKTGPKVKGIGLAGIFFTEIGRYASKSAANYLIKVVEENIEKNRRKNVS